MTAGIPLRAQAEAVEIAAQIINGGARPRRAQERELLRERLMAAAETLRRMAGKTDT
jgi:hypothetical protein